MIKKTVKKLSKVKARLKEKPSPSASHPPARLITAEGWKRLMMRKTRS